MVDPDSEMMTAKYYEPDEISVLLSSTSPYRKVREEIFSI